MNETCHMCAWMSHVTCVHEWVVTSVFEGASNHELCRANEIYWTWRWREEIRVTPCLCKREFWSWPTLRVTKPEALPEYHIGTTKRPPSSLPFSDMFMKPLLWNCPCPEDFFGIYSFIDDDEGNPLPWTFHSVGRTSKSSPGQVHSHSGWPAPLLIGVQSALNSGGRQSLVRKGCWLQPCALIFKTFWVNFWK